MSTTRDERIDILKGIAIFLVVLGHINAPAILTDFIYSFHMPLFMFLSGCTFWYSYSKRIGEQADSKKYFTYIAHRFSALIFPYITWSLIYGFIYKKNTDVTKALLQSFSVYWFLPTLFGIILIVGLAELLAMKVVPEASIKNLLIEASVITVLCGVSAALHLLTNVKLFREILIYMPPFYVGLAEKKYDFISKIFSSKGALTVCMIVSFSLIPFYTKSNKSLPVLLIRLISGITSTEVIYNFVYSKRCDINSLSSGYIKLLEYLKYLGKHSLEIYIISEFFNDLFYIYIPTSGTVYDAAIKFAFSVIICFVCILIANIIRQSDMLSIVLFGGKADRLEKVNRSA